VRPRELTVAHEAAHVVARYILGTLEHVDLVEVPYSGNAGAGAAGRVGVKRGIADATRTRDEAEREIVSALAGSAALRELRLDESGGEADEEIAGTIALAFTNWSRAEAMELYDDCLARTERLVASWRFQDLLLRLYKE
jgi:hypothetical protein